MKRQARAIATNMHYKFTKLFITMVIGGLGIFFLLVIFVDPFSIYNAPLISGFNREKIIDANLRRLVVASDIVHKKPKSIILGTSRTKHGIDAQDAKKQTGQEFLNCSLCAASFDEMYAYFLHALHVQPKLQTVIIGIDLFSFRKDRPCQNGFTEERLQINGYDPKDVCETIFTWKALSCSYETVKLNLIKSDLLPFKVHSRYEKEEINPILLTGDFHFLKQWLENKDYYNCYEIGQDKLDKFKSLVEICKIKGIDLKVFVCPVKAMFWEYYYQNGLWPAVEKLKRDLCTIHPLWDFSGYTPLTTETINSENHLYLEFSHFTSFAGQILLKQMFEGPIISNIGRLLTPETIDAHLTKILEDRQPWLHGPGSEIHVNFNEGKSYKNSRF